MIEYFNFGLTFLAAVCLSATLFYLWKYKTKEDERLWKGLNALFFSLVVLDIYLSAKAFALFVGMFGWLENIIYDINLVLNIGLTPLIVICMFIGILLFREV